MPTGCSRRYSLATMRSIWQTGWAYPSRGNLLILNLSRNFHMPAEGDDEMAGAPADSEVTIPATAEEI
eukprot:8000950-Pyramimonas_sp.AAC.1